MLNHRKQDLYSNHKQAFITCLTDHGFKPVYQVKSNGYKFDDTQELTSFVDQNGHQIDLLTSFNSELMGIISYNIKGLPLASYALRNHTCKLEYTDQDLLTEAFSKLVNIGMNNYRILKEKCFNPTQSIELLNKFQSIKLAWYKDHGSTCLPILIPAIEKNVNGLEILTIAKQILLEGLALAITGKKVRKIKCLRTRHNLLTAFTGLALV